MARFYRRRYRRYSRNYRRRRRLALRPYRTVTTKTFTMTFKYTRSVSFSFPSNQVLSDVVGMSALIGGYGEDDDRGSVLENSPNFQQLKQLFGEYKINSMYVKLTPALGAASVPVTVFCVPDRRLRPAEESFPSAATVSTSAVSTQRSFTSASTMTMSRSIYAQGATERGTWQDGTHSGSVNYGFMPAFYFCLRTTAASSSAGSITASLTGSVSVTFRNPCF